METDPNSRKDRPSDLVLVRHGESESNVYQHAVDRGEAFGYPKKFSAVRDVDVRLTSAGREQARKTGVYLAQKFGSFSACYVSPFRRTRQTFEEIIQGYEPKERERMLADARYDYRLKEKHHGSIAFHSKEQVRKKYPEEWRRRQVEGKFDYRPLGGESWDDVALRIHVFLGTVFRDRPDQKVLVVSHSVVIHLFRFLLSRLSQEEIVRIADTENLSNCAIAHYQFDPQAGKRGRLVLRDWGRTTYPRTESRKGRG